MNEVEILNEIKNDLNFLKEKIIRMEITINEIDSDVHKKLNPEYANELKKIEENDTRIHFTNIKEFDRHFEF